MKTLLTEIIKPHSGHHKHQNIVLEPYKSIYFFIPKVACTSLKKVISDTLDIPPYDPSQPDSYIHLRNFPYIRKSKIDKNYKMYFKFCFVRNPFDRIVSCYSNKISQDKTLNNEWFSNGVARIFKKYKQAFWGGMRFENFLTSVANIDDNRADPHFRSQWTTVVDNKNNYLPDFIGKFENLQKDFAFVTKKIGFPVNELPHLLKSDHKNYRNYYNEKTITLVRQRYARDLEMFSYDF